MKNNLIETWLPVFTGFYSNPFWDTDDNESYEISEINRERAEKGFLNDIDWNHCKWDYEQYNNDIAENLTYAVEEKLKELNLVTWIKFQSISSPKFYNFINDSINCEIEMSEENISNLLAYVSEAFEDFKQYIKDTYTSYDGFWCNYSNDVKDWMKVFTDGTIFDSKHHLGAILQFVCMNEEITEDSLYYDAKDGCHISCYLENRDELLESEVCSECGELISLENSKEYTEYVKTRDFQIKEYKRIMGKEPSEVKNFDCRKLTCLCAE